mmetsp:Transcript_23946/g.77063  ORF Transcript_23946/g.77063 Transcript_23946/m.77063 type:complete len:289 (+) Transcript_23946:162-1028(+)
MSTKTPPPKKKAYYEDTNAMPMANGRVTHVGVGEGDVANRVVTVGSLSRAEALASEFLLDCRSISSPRGFTTFTGTFGGVAVSVVATGMGAPMMDFFVRETRAIVDGPMLVVRLGTCGAIDVDPGAVVANTPGSYAVSRNYDAWIDDDKKGTEEPPYRFTKIVEPDAALAEAVADALKATEDLDVVEGLNASTTSFYSDQGRQDPNFDDRNDRWIDDLLKPDTVSTEMESFHLLHLSKCAKRHPIKAATTAIACAERKSGKVIDEDTLKAVELKAGKAILQALADSSL